MKRLLGGVSRGLLVAQLCWGCSGSTHTVTPAGETAFIVDGTDSMRPGGLGSLGLIQNFTHERLALTHRGDQLSIHFLDSQSIRPRDVWSTTCPPRGVEVDPLVEGRAFADRAYDDEVTIPVDSVIVLAGQVGGPSSRSAIVEAIWAVSTLSSFHSASGPRQLCIISDMLQNSDYADFYRAAHERLMRPDGKLLFPQWRPDLRDVDVYILLVLRDGDSRLQSPALIAEWNRFFEACGAHATWSSVTVPS